MQFKARCCIPNVIGTEREIADFSHIEADRVVYQHVAKYPSFKERRSTSKFTYTNMAWMKPCTTISKMP